MFCLATISSAVFCFINGTRGHFGRKSPFSGLVESKMRRTTGEDGCGSALLQSNRGGRARSRMKTLAIVVPACENALRLLGREESATRANKARLGKERASGQEDTGYYHLWKITKPREADPTRKPMANFQCWKGLLCPQASPHVIVSYCSRIRTG